MSSSTAINLPPLSTLVGKTPEQIFQDVFAFENGYGPGFKVVAGKFSDTPGDAGGATMLGMTQATWSEYLGRPATVAEIKALTPETVMPGYLDLFFHRPRFDLLPADGLIREEIIDTGVGSGTERATILLQGVLNPFVPKSPLLVDGDCGPKTVGVLQQVRLAMGDGHVTLAYIAARNAYYGGIAQYNPSQVKFLQGWHNRANKLQPYAEREVQETDPVKPGSSQLGLPGVL